MLIRVVLTLVAAGLAVTYIHAYPRYVCTCIYMSVCARLLFVCVCACTYQLIALTMCWNMYEPAATSMRRGGARLFVCV